MKPTTIFFLLLLSLPLATTAQNKQLDFKYGIKLYNTSSYSMDVRSNDGSVRIKDRVIDYLQPSVAFQVKAKNNNFHEIELARFQMSNNLYQLDKFDPASHSWKNADEYRGNYVNIQLRYEYILNFNKKKDSRWLPALGLSAMPYLTYANGKSNLSTIFPRSEATVGIRGFVIPRVSYRISKRLFAELNVPITLGDLNYTHKRHKDPSLSAGEQINSLITFDGMSMPYQIRLGIGLRL